MTLSIRPCGETRIQLNIALFDIKQYKILIDDFNAQERTEALRMVPSVDAVRNRIKENLILVGGIVYFSAHITPQSYPLAKVLLSILGPLDAEWFVQNRLEKGRLRFMTIPRDLTDYEAIALAHALKGSDLITLRVWNDDMTEVGVRAIANALDGSKIKELYFVSSRGLSEAERKILSRAEQALRLKKRDIIIEDIPR